MIKRRYIVAAAAAVLLVGGGGAVAYADESGAWDGTDGAGLIHGCISPTTQLRVINTAEGQKCWPGETPLSWSQGQGSGGTSNGNNVLGTASNAGTVTGPVMSSDSSAAQPVASVTFTVPAGHSYQVQASAQAVITSQGGGCAGAQTTWSGGSLSLFADGDYTHNLMGYSNGWLPGGATGGSQVIVFGAGAHTVAIVNAPSQCSSVADPGSASFSNAFLSVNLLGEF